MTDTLFDWRGLVFIAVLLAWWWVATGVLGLLPAFVLPPPADVWRSFVELGFGGDSGGLLLGYRATLWMHIAASVGRLWAAFTIAAVVAIPMGVLMASFKPIDDFFDLIMQSLRPIPPIAWTPLAILWFGVGLPPMLFIIILGAFWPILLNTIVGVREVRKVLIRAGQSLGATPAQVFARIVVPAAMPHIYVGLRSGIMVGWWMIVPAEMITADTGLGFLIMRARENGHTQHVLTGMITIALVGFAFHLLLARLGDLRLFRPA